MAYPMLAAALRDRLAHGLGRGDIAPARAALAQLLHRRRRRRSGADDEDLVVRVAREHAAPHRRAARRRRFEQRSGKDKTQRAGNDLQRSV